MPATLDAPVADILVVTSGGRGEAVPTVACARWTRVWTSGAALAVLCTARFDLVVICLDGDDDPVWPVVRALAAALWEQPFALVVRRLSPGPTAAARASGAVAVVSSADSDAPDHAVGHVLPLVLGWSDRTADA